MAKEIIHGADSLFTRKIIGKTKDLKNIKKTPSFWLTNQSHSSSYISIYRIQKKPFEDIPKVEPFNQYFSGGFNGLVVK